MKILNLNKLSQVSTRTLSINDVAYPVKVMSTEDFIEITAAAQKLAAGGSAIEQVTGAIDMICRMVPTAPRAELVKYDLGMLNTISEFVRGEDVEEQEEVEAGEASGK